MLVDDRVENLGERTVEEEEEVYLFRPQVVRLYIAAVSCLDGLCYLEIGGQIRL